MDPRDRVVGDTGGIPPDQLPIIHIKCTHNNTIFTVTDFAGKTLAWTSAVRERVLMTVDHTG